MSEEEKILKEDVRTIRTKRDLANALEELLQEKNFDEIAIKDITDAALISKILSIIISMTKLNY